MLTHIDELAKHIKELDAEIDSSMKDEEKISAARIQEIPGIGNTSAEVIISVLGTDMTRFPTDAHISSCAGLCPGNNESAGKRRSGKTRKGNALLRSTLIVCAHSAIKSKNSYFYAQFQRISAHRGKKACLRCNRPFYADSHLSHAKRWYTVPRSWSRLL